MKRIALIRSASSVVSKSGYNIQEISMAKELAKRELKVDVFLISDKNQTYKEKTGYKDLVTVYWLKGIKIPGQQGYYKDLNRILDSHKYDLIQALDDSQITTVLTSMYCKKRNIKFVLWQGMYENYPEKYKRLIQYLFDWTLLKILRKNTKYCIAKTTSAKHYLEQKRFSNIDVIPVGLETENFSSGVSIDYRGKFSIEPDKKILLYVGKVEDRRKPLFCMDVYEKVKNGFENCCLIYVGKGPMLDQVHNYASNKGLIDVYFIEQIPQNELASLYKESSMFILPTRYEIFGMVLMEAMYFGVPVITYKAAGPIDVISNDIDGIVMNDFEADHWAEKIIYHLKKNNCPVMGEKARKKIIDNYVWSKIANQNYIKYMDIIDNE